MDSKLQKFLDEKRCYIFDLDGTLLNTLEDLKNAVNYALRTMDMPVYHLNQK